MTSAPARTASVHRSLHAQRGVALITAVLIVALATIAATAIAMSGDAAMHRAMILQETERAWWFADGVQSWTRTILKRDAEDSQYDGLNEAWAQPIDYLPLDGGFVSGSIVDQQGLFNLNNLGVSNIQDYERYKTQFGRLLSQIEGLDPTVAERLAPAIRDWIDSDQDPTPFDGAEDLHYLGLERAYRAGNRPLASVSELLLINGMTPDIYRALRPLVSALPTYPTPINVNTAAEPVLRSLIAESPGSAFDSFLLDRLEKPAETVTEVTANGVLGASDAPDQDISVSSNYFMSCANTTIGNSRVALCSLFVRVGGSDPVLIAQSTDDL